MHCRSSSQLRAHIHQMVKHSRFQKPTSALTPLIRFSPEEAMFRNKKLQGANANAHRPLANCERHIRTVRQKHCTYLHCIIFCNKVEPENSSSQKNNSFIVVIVPMISIISTRSGNFQPRSGKVQILLATWAVHLTCCRSFQLREHPTRSLAAPGLRTM
jgi:hypothetical protein